MPATHPALDDDFDPIEPQPMSDEALALHRALAENAELRDTVKRLEAALRAAGRVLTPYIQRTGVRA